MPYFIWNSISQPSQEYKACCQLPTLANAKYRFRKNISIAFDTTWPKTSSRTGLTNTHVTISAKNRDGMFPGLPEVALITLDDYPDGKHSQHMTVSINTAISLVVILSDDDDQTGITRGLTIDSCTVQPIPTSIRGWPTPSGNLAETPSSSTPYSTALDQTILNDLASSRAEVKALKTQVSQLVAQRESQTQQSRSCSRPSGPCFVSYPGNNLSSSSYADSRQGHCSV